MCIYSLVLFPSRVAKRLIKVNYHGDNHQGNGCTTEYYNIIADVQFYTCQWYVQVDSVVADMHNSIILVRCKASWGEPEQFYKQLYVAMCV